MAREAIRLGEHGSGSRRRCACLLDDQRLLQQIRGEIERMSPYQFSIQASYILRRYVSQQYGLPATRQTSIEFLSAAAKAPSFSADDKSLLEDFLNRCDLIKFAKYEATTSDSELLLEEAIRFVKGGQLAAV